MQRFGRWGSFTTIAIVTGLVLQCGPEAVDQVLDGSPDAFAEVDGGGVCDCGAELAALGSRLGGLEERLAEAEGELEALAARPGVQRTVIVGELPGAGGLELPIPGFDADDMPAVQVFIQGAGGELGHWQEAELVIRADGTIYATASAPGPAYRVVLVR